MKSSKVIFGLWSLMSVCFSCEKEYEQHCERHDSSGQICKELRYEEGVLAEALSYEYGNNGLVSLKLHENKNGKNIGQVIYTYDSQNNLLSEVFKDAEKEIIISNAWNYNEQGQINVFESEVYGVKKESRLSYANGILQQVKTYADNSVVWNSVYSYFDNDTVSYDVLTYDGDSVLLSVNQHRWFDSSTTRIEKYDAFGDLNGYKVLLFNAEAELIEKRTYDKQLKLLHSEEYLYDNGVVAEYSFLSDIEPNKRTVYMR